jgi:hypothetical protein
LLLVPKTIVLGLRSIHLPKVKQMLSGLRHRTNSRGAAGTTRSIESYMSRLFRAAFVPKERRMSTSEVLRSRSRTMRSVWLALFLAFPTFLEAQAGLAQSIGPFDKFLGYWRGSGHIVGSDGRSERITCRATYSESDGGDALSQSLVCASDSYRFDIHSYVVADGQSVQGHWDETTRNVTGHLTGQIKDGLFQGSVAGPSFTAEMSLRTNGRKQAVSITPQGGGITRIDLELLRAS